MDVYWTNIEYGYKKGAINYGRYAGGYVYAFVQANDVRDAIEKYEDDLNALNLYIKCIDFVAIYEDIPWETEEDQGKYDSIAAAASEMEGVIWDEFEAYEEE